MYSQCMCTVVKPNKLISTLFISDILQTIYHERLNHRDLMNEEFKRILDSQYLLKLLLRMAPASKGLGYGMLIISFLVVIYYNMIIAWTLFYTVAGLSAELPWQFCGNTTLTR